MIEFLKVRHSRVVARLRKKLDIHSCAKYNQRQPSEARLGEARQSMKAVDQSYNAKRLTGTTLIGLFSGNTYTYTL